MADKKMTMREFCEAVLASNADETVKAFASAELGKLDARNEKRKNTKSKAQIENEAICDKIVALLTEKGKMVASDIGAALDISTQKASALCRLLVDGGELVQSDHKVKGKGAVKAYSLSPSTVADSE